MQEGPNVSLVLALLSLPDIVHETNSLLREITASTSPLDKTSIQPPRPSLVERWFGRTLGV
jgi:hypothetical protein